MKVVSEKDTNENYLFFFFLVDIIYLFLTERKEGMHVRACMHRRAREGKGVGERQAPCSAPWR